MDFSHNFRVPSLDELARGDAPKIGECLMNLGAGVSWLTPYTFSDPSLDLAVISLRDGPEKLFANELIAKGYCPIGLADVEGRPSREGAEVVSVGYPNAVSVLAEVSLDASLVQWASSAVSLPVFSWGRVAMRHEALPFFWADLTIYPGNSGGPVIESDKLVGIVSAQAKVEDTRVPFAKIINASMIHELLRTQVVKDAGSTGMRKPSGT